MDPTTITVDAGVLRIMLAQVRAAHPPRILWSEDRSRMDAAARLAMTEALAEIDRELSHLLGLDLPA